MQLPLGFVAKYRGRTHRVPKYALVKTGGSETPSRESIDNTIHFFSETVSISHTTVHGGNDDGVPRLTVKFKDGGLSDFPLSDGGVAIETMATPGRIRANGVEGDPSNTLQFPGWPFPHLWRSGGSISTSYDTTADTDQIVNETWTGWAFEVKTFPTTDSFWTALEEYAHGAIPR